MESSSEMLGLTASAWTAVGVLVAAAAAVVAIVQLRLARRQAEDRARAFMSILAEPGLGSNSVIDIVMRNLGASAAYDLRVDLDPPMVRAEEVPGHLFMDARAFSDQIPMWPPGQERRFFFDIHHLRADRGLPEQHTATLTYRFKAAEVQGRWWLPDSARKLIEKRRQARATVTEQHVIDLAMTKGALNATVYGVHDITKEMRKIRKLLAKSLREGDSRSGFADPAQLFDPRPGGVE